MDSKAVGVAEAFILGVKIRILLIRYLSNLEKDLGLTIFISISDSLDCCRKQMWICPEKRQRSCTKKKMSVR